MTKTIWFIRHAESEFNRLEAIAGDLEAEELRDCCITTLGIRQACQLGHELSDVKFDAVVVSPLRRALETLQCIPALANHRNIIVNGLCREHKTDVCDFLFNEVVVFETHYQLMQRIEKFKHYLLYELPDYYTIAVISHGDFIYHICETSKTGEQSQYWLDNASYTVVNWNLSPNSAF
jgi:broad specificity phosphatase PhoE